MGFGLLNVNMINKMKKRIILLVISIIISLDVYSICYNSNGIQNCKETDSINKQTCIQLVSVFTEKYKQKRILLQHISHGHGYLKIALSNQ